MADDAGYPVPEHEDERLAALEHYRILDTPQDDSFDRITRLASRILGTPIALISLVDSSRQWFKSRVGMEAGETPREHAFCAHAICSHEVMVVSDTHGDERFRANPLVTGSPGVRFYAAAPLTTRDGLNLGTLCVIDQEPREITEEQAAILEDLAQLAMDEIELRYAGLKAMEEIAERRRLEEELRRLSQSDDLTAVANRRHFLASGERELRRARRYGRSIAVLMIDIDRFKTVNDTHGHAAGDAMLRGVGRALRATLREIDLIGRMGGEEFAAVLPETNRVGALDAAERVRAAVEAMVVPVERKELRCTVSVGVALAGGEGEALDQLLQWADSALYAAKAGGRNRVVAVDE